MIWEKKRIAIGEEFFADIITDCCYYVDKTGLIRDLITRGSKVTLITRPRRFGKTLNLTMMRDFFSPEADKHIFDGLEISKETEICEKYMGQHPAIFMTLSCVNGSNFDWALDALSSHIMLTAWKFDFLKDSKKLSKNDKAIFDKLMDDENMDKETAIDGLHLLCQLLEKHYGKKAVLLIDEYDVPLAFAQQYGYYDQMVSLLRSFFDASLRANDSLEFAVLTGCLNVPAESIFPEIAMDTCSVTDERYDKYVGFTDEDVRNMFDYYGVSEHYDTARKEYSGFRFGKQEMYSPWDVIKFCDYLTDHPSYVWPKNYWVDTSGNDPIKDFVAIKEDKHRKDLECLLTGGKIERKISEHLSYETMYSNTDDFWTLLLSTGYFTQHGKTDDGLYTLTITNREIKKLFTDIISDQLKRSVRADPETCDAFWSALQDGDADAAEKIITKYLAEPLFYSIDKPDACRESYYHEFLRDIAEANGTLGYTASEEPYEKYKEILLKSFDKDIGIVIGIKYADDGDMEKAAREALEQPVKAGYAKALDDRYIDDAMKYGIGFFGRSCKVICGGCERLKDQQED